MIKRNYNQMLNENNNLEAISTNQENNNTSIYILTLPKLYYVPNVTNDFKVNNIKYPLNLSIDDESLYDNINIYTINIYIKKIKNFKIFIPVSYFNIISIYQDGNCFFRAVSKFLTDDEKYYLYFRNIVYNYFKIHKTEILIQNPYIYYNGNSIDLEDYINLLKNSGAFDGKLEIGIISKIFNISIYVLEATDNNQNYMFLYK